MRQFLAFEGKTTVSVWAVVVGVVVVSRAAVPVAVCPRTFATIEQTLRLDEEQCGVGRRP